MFVICATLIIIMSYYDKSTAGVAIVYIIRSSDGSILIVGFVFGQENSF
jgi:hypothetical protein